MICQQVAPLSHCLKERRRNVKSLTNTPAIFSDKSVSCPDSGTLHKLLAGLTTLQRYKHKNKINFSILTIWTSCIHIHTCIRLYYIYIYIIGLQKYSCMHPLYTYIHTYTHTHTHIYIYIY